MTDPLYKTPNNRYVVYMNTDCKWQEVFGFESGWYSIVLTEDDYPNTIPVRQEFTLEDCFKWLWQHNIISKDEMLYQIKEKC